AFVSIVAIENGDGWSDRYVLPLALLSGERAEHKLRNTPSAGVARITGARQGVIVDGLYDDDLCDWLLERIDRGYETPAARGLVRGVLTGDPLDLSGECKWARGGGDQSNSVVFMSERYALKMFRRIEPGPNPEFEIGRL